MPSILASAAPLPYALCDTFCRLAHWVWEQRRAAKKVGFPFWEVTVTQSILLDLKVNHPHDIGVYPFTWSGERDTGADWEWCFHDVPSGAVSRILVQAKVLDDRDENYSHIDHTIGSSGVLQIERLIDTAQKRGVRAVYAFYNHLRDVTRLPPQTSPCDKCWGVSVALAEDVGRLLPDKSFDTLKDWSLPWARLVCDGEGQDSTLPQRVNFALGELESKREGDTLAKRDMSGGDPTYLSLIQDLVGMPEGGDRETLLRRLAVENPGVAGLVYIRSGGPKE